jgi:hypothetical protein
MAKRLETLMENFTMQPTTKKLCSTQEDIWLSTAALEGWIEMALEYPFLCQRCILADDIGLGKTR